MTRRLVVAVWSVAVSAIAVGGSAAQDLQYLMLLDTYAKGNIQDAVEACATWSDTQARAAAQLIGRGQSSHLVKAAVMLHTEVAFALNPDKRSLAHLNLARTIVAGLSEQPAADEFVARWHVLVGTLHAMRDDFASAERELHLGRARRAGVRDLEFASGVFLEMETQSIRPGRDFQILSGGEPRRRGSTFGVGILENDLHSLVTTYQRVVERHPDFLEARLRLGWAYYLDKSLARARAELERVAARATRPDLRYLAHLFLGAVAQRDGRLEVAASEYEAAHAAEPHQSSLVALIGLTRALGRDSRVQELAAQFAARPPGRDQDPWWHFTAGLTGSALLDALRAETRMP